MKGIRMTGLGLLLGLALTAVGAEKVLFTADFLRQVKPTATRTVTEETGIYCVVGAEARFKPVEVVYIREGMEISAAWPFWSIPS